jgi:hypothetical protein
VQESNGLSFDKDWSAVKTADGLRRALDGWFRHSGHRMPPDGYRVVGVESAFAAPILNPKGSAYAPITYLTKTASGLRLARTGEAVVPSAQVQAVRWPWYQLGKLDALLQDRGNGDLLVWEGKSSASPAGYLQGLSIDPQVPGYVWLLEHHLESFGAKRVIGYIYDVSSSTYQADPVLLKADSVKVLGPDGAPLKIKGRNVYELDEAGAPVQRSPGLSRAAGHTPSWAYHAAIVKHGFDPSDYADHLQKLQVQVDSDLYVRDLGTVGPEIVRRYGRELYGVASRLAQLRRDAATALAGESDWLFPRTTVCRLGNTVRCPYRAPCLMDGPDARSAFEVTDTMVWLDNEQPLPFEGTEEGELGW